MGQHILFSLWFFWPGGVATAMPVLLAKAPTLKNWNAPMDGGLSFHGQRILGDHKTWRGLILGGLAGVIWFLVERIIYQHSAYVRNFSPVDYESISMFWCAVLLSYGSLIGDAIKSFFKRQIGIKAGDSWIPFDQLDHLLGGLILSLIAVRLSLEYYMYIIVIWFMLHLITSYIGYILKLKDHPI